MSAKPEKPCDTVARGGVGESGASSMLHYEVEAGRKQSMVLERTTSSLCPNTGAVAMLVVNGDVVAHGNITAEGSSIRAKANPGDHVIAIVHTIPLFNEIVCIRLGELSFELNACAPGA